MASMSNALHNLRLLLVLKESCCNNSSTLCFKYLIRTDLSLHDFGLPYNGTFSFRVLFIFTLFFSSRLEGDDITEICKKNLAAAMTTGRKDLVQTWSLLSLVLDKKLAPSDSMDESPWALHPFGRKMVSSL